MKAKIRKLEERVEKKELPQIWERITQYKEDYFLVSEKLLKLLDLSLEDYPEPPPEKYKRAERIIHKNEAFLKKLLLECDQDKAIYKGKKIKSIIRIIAKE